jgi:SAM-dependent methyltransferase
MLLKMLYHALAPNFRYLKAYRRALEDMGNAEKEFYGILRDLAANSNGKRCLQIGVMEGAKIAPHWIAVDLYDTSPLIDYNYDVHDLKFPDASFDIVVCTAVLEHVPWPQKAVHELGRVLRPGGLILVGLPWAQPFHEMPKDYWRASPDGLRVWMSEFTEIRCACMAQERSALYTSVFFYGRKKMQIGCSA